MDMKLYGICFKLRGGPDLLDYVQNNKPVPLEVMGQVMDQAGSVTEKEKEFARELENDWKKAYNEKVPLTMVIGADGGYDISCVVPDELLATTRLLTGMKNEQIVEDYIDNYLKNVCGVNADIISVDSEKIDEAEVKAAVESKQQEAQAPGFVLEDLNDMSFEATYLDDVPTAQEPEQEPAYEEEPEQEPYEEEPEQEYEPEQEPAYEEEPQIEEEPEQEPEYEEEPEQEPYEEEPQVEEEPEQEPYEEEPEQEPVQEESQSNEMANALEGIYKDFVTNIKARNLDERLGLRIGQ